jgi:5,10-methylenetetrahydromethanopterin reductase
VTAGPRLGISLSNELPVADTVAFAESAERLGFAEAWLPESRHGRSVFTVAAQIAARTSRLGIGIGVVNPFWRHPSVIAMEAAALDEASGGRVRLGVGAALWTLRALGEDDPRTGRPLTAMREALGIIRFMVSGGPRPDPWIFTAGADTHLDFRATRPRLPVYVGAVNARMLEASGALADGVQLGAITSPGYVRWARDRVTAGARDAGRDPADVDLAANVLVSVDGDAAAREATRTVLAYYLHRVEGVVTGTSGADPEQVETVRRAVTDGGIAAGARSVTDSLIDVFAAAGDPDQVAARLHDYTAAGLCGGPRPHRGLELLATEVAPKL